MITNITYIYVINKTDIGDINQCFMWHVQLYIQFVFMVERTITFRNNLHPQLNDARI